MISSLGIEVWNIVKKEDKYEIGKDHGYSRSSFIINFSTSKSCKPFFSSLNLSIFSFKSASTLWPILFFLNPRYYFHFCAFALASVLTAFLFFLFLIIFVFFSSFSIFFFFFWTLSQWRASLLRANREIFRDLFLYFSSHTFFRSTPPPPRPLSLSSGSDHLPFTLRHPFSFNHFLSRP